MRCSACTWWRAPDWEQEAGRVTGHRRAWGNLNTSTMVLERGQHHELTVRNQDLTLPCGLIWFARSGLPPTTPAPCAIGSGAGAPALAGSSERKDGKLCTHQSHAETSMLRYSPRAIHEEQKTKTYHALDVNSTRPHIPAGGGSRLPLSSHTTSAELATN